MNLEHTHDIKSIYNFEFVKMYNCKFVQVLLINQAVIIRQKCGLIGLLV